MCVCLVAQSCLTLCNPMYCSSLVSLSMEFSRQEYCSGLPFPPLGDLSDPGIKATFPALPARFFTTEIPVKPKELVHTLDKEYPKLDNKQLTQLKIDLIFF